MATATATPIRSSASSGGASSRIPSQYIGLQQQIEFRRDLMRRGEITRDNGQGGWIVLGKLLELRYERTADHGPIPQHLQSIFATKGNVLDWQQPKFAPLIGTDRGRSVLLVVSDVGPLPDVIDPKASQQQFVELDGNKIPLGCIPPNYLERMQKMGRRVKGANQTLDKPETIQQKFVDHACGSMGEFLVIRPITEAWVQLSGVKAIQKLIFQPRGNDYPGFYLNPATGEAHFLGGSSDLENRVG